ncbi:carbohydrate kinase family protein [Flexivirga oryzae]|uniref:Pseudouridine kinase n=1 Tax=Flexivirga oryzae TaxID=1794944 RepID=A0A839N9W6_9MICO|nr:carbohydrate kinase family protein [Flexivirga oryzae]MBB2892983.1 pseudouridine kinase [Flexivirga oryzae]
MGAVLVVGGANVDVIARSAAPFVAGTSNPGTAHSSAGGVGRNIAANLGLLGVPTTLIAAFGNDTFGRRLEDETRSAGVDLGHAVQLPMPSGSYLAMLDADGELVGAVSDMTATESLLPEHVREGVVAAASYLVVDTNLSAPLLEHVCRTAASHGVPVVLDPVSDLKAQRLLPVLGAVPIHTITPTRSELAALSGESDLVSGVHALHAAGIAKVWVREGARGSTLFGEDAAVHIPAIPAEVRDVTGAGDAMCAAYVHGLTIGLDDATAATRGAVAAYLTITSDFTVRPDLSAELVEHVMEEKR